MGWLWWFVPGGAAVLTLALTAFLAAALGQLVLVPLGVLVAVGVFLDLSWDMELL